MKTALLVCIMSVGLLISCSCPSDEAIGSVSLQSPSTKFHPYGATETLTFVTKNNEEKVFYINQEQESNAPGMIVTEKPCEKSRFDYQSLYYSTERYHTEFRGEGCMFRYTLSTYAYTGNNSFSKDTVLYDLFALYGYTNEQSSTSIEVVTSLRGNEDHLPEDWVKENSGENHSFIADTTLVHTSFQNVYFQKDKNTFFFVPDVGVVGFFDGNKMWEIKKTEG